MAETNPPGSGADPSMDDILASIRRILSEDEAAASAHPAPAEPAQPVHPAPAPAALAEQPNAGGSGGADDEGVLILDEAMLVADPAATAAAPPPASSPSGGASAQAQGGLVAPEAAAAAASHVGALLRTIASDRSAQISRGGATIEDLVREELRPLLKVWLDQHLPPLVERLVRAEIERVVGRAL